MANATAARALVVVHSNAGRQAVGEALLGNEGVADVGVLDAGVKLPTRRRALGLHIHVPT